MRFLKKSIIGKVKMVAVIVALALLPLTGAAASTLMGDQINAELIYPTDFANQPVISSDTAIVGSGVEFTINSSTGREVFTVDIGASYIKMKLDPNTFYNAGFSRQLHISGIDWFGEPSVTIESVTLEIGNDYFGDPEGIVAGDITFTEHSLTFEWGNSSYWPRSSWAQINLTPSSGGDDPTPSIPEPTTMILFGLGLLGLTGVNRRQK